MTAAGTEREHERRDDLVKQYETSLSGDAAEEVRESVSRRYADYKSLDVPFAGLLDGWPDAMAAMRDDPKAEKYLQQLRARIDKDDYLASRMRLQSLLPLTKPDGKPHGIAGLGMVQAFHDADGEIRRNDIVGLHGDQTFRTLPLETWRLYVLSYAREAAAKNDAAGFARRFPELELDSNALKVDGKSYSLKDGLRDVPVVLTDDTARYLGREVSIDASGRMELRYRNWLDFHDMPTYPQYKEEFESRYADQPPFAVYPQVSAKNILKDWDLLSANRKREAEIAKEEKEIKELQGLIPDASKEDVVYLKEDLLSAQERLAKARARPVYELAQGDPAGLVKDKVVFIAWTATALSDRHPTPLDPNTPGTWVLATAFDNFKNQDFMTSQPRWLQWLGALLAAVLAVLGVMYAGKLQRGFVLVLAMGAVVLVVSWLGFEQQVWVHTMGPLAGLLFGFSQGALAKALTEGRQRRQRETFARQYMGKELLDHVIKNPASLKLGGENREMTMYFSDVAGFTTVTETLGPENPERLVELLNIYLERMTDIMLGTGGVIDKYIGDAIMCFWGAPMSQEDHAVRACRGALECRAELQRMQPLFADAVREIAPQLIKPDGSVLYARAGINSGMVTVGNMGSSKRFAYTVMGDAVNLAARLEPQCKSYGTDILIGEKTEQKVRGEFTLRPIDLIVVKGKTEPVEVFELMGDKNPPQFILDLVKHFSEGIKLFRDRHFEAALEEFKHAAHHETSAEEEALNPSRLYLQRCEELLRNPPPPDWNGVYIKTSK
jgi:class 3 adenylate cyclase